MNTRMWVRLLFLLFLVGAIADAAFGQSYEEEPSRGLPEPFRWVLAAPVYEEEMIFVSPKNPDNMAPHYTFAIISAGVVLKASHLWVPNPALLEPAPDGEYVVRYRTMFLSRFDPALHQVPSEPANRSERVRRWLASEVIAVSAMVSPAAIGWFKDKYLEEIMELISQIDLDNFGGAGSRKKKKPPAPEEQPGPSTPTMPSQPAKVVRRNAAPALAGRFNPTV
ncbi:MAG: hypothetical protein AAB667_01730 [Patescibacteria group bacterium]